MTPIERQAEDIVRAMVAQSWNEEVETVAALLRDLEAARKVADAAVAGHIVWGAFSRTYFAEPVDYEARAELLRALGETRDAMAVAVREYRAHVERQGRRCEYKFNEPEPPVSTGKPCDLGHDNPALRQDSEAQYRERVEGVER